MTVLIIVVAILALRNSPVIFVNSDATRALSPSSPDPQTLEKEAIRVLKKYLVTRHNWEASNIDSKSKDASAYVASDFREKYLLGSQEQIRLAKEKQVSQKLFPDDPVIDLKEKKATVKAERILIVSGIRASQAMVFELTFQFGERTAINPEGIYITSESLTTAAGS